MYERQLRSTLVARLQIIFDQAAHAPQIDNEQLIQDLVKEAVRYGGVAREALNSGRLKQDSSFATRIRS
jgi:hypothetical protein